MKWMAIAAPLALAGCQTLQSPTVVNTLAEVCSYEPLAYAAFVIFSPRADPRVVVRVNQAHRIVTDICLAPPTTVPAAFNTALNAYLIITEATP